MLSINHCNISKQTIVATHSSICVSTKTQKVLNNSDILVKDAPVPYGSLNTSFPPMGKYEFKRTIPPQYEIMHSIMC